MAVMILYSRVKYTNYTFNFHPLEVVDRGSETQLEVGENLNLLLFCIYSPDFLYHRIISRINQSVIIFNLFFM